MSENNNGGSSSIKGSGSEVIDNHTERSVPKRRQYYVDRRGGIHWSRKDLMEANRSLWMRS